MQAFEMSTDNKLDRFQIQICLTTEEFSTLPELILNEVQLREDGSISGLCSLHNFFLHH